GCVAFGMTHGGDTLGAKQVVRERHNGNALSCFLCCACRFGPGYHQYIWPCLGQFNRDSRVGGRSHADSTAINFKVAAFYKSGLAQFIEEALVQWRPQNRNAVPPADSCPRASSGHAVAPPISVMNSRRLIEPPEETP